MKIQEFLNKTHKETGKMQNTRPQIICNDGFKMSVQAGYGIYSKPGSNGKIPYSAVEIGYPNEEEKLLFGLEGDKGNYTNTVYPFVQIEIVDEVIEKHNGINIDETFKTKKWRN
jgi:hypothetical protein